MNNRDTAFDNLRGLLIYLVVLGHLLEISSRFTSNQTYSDLAHQIIYAFHMPAMALISGFFSKRENYPRTVKTFIVFAMFHGLAWMIFDRNSFSILSPSYATWYLFSLCCWRLMVLPAVCIRYPIILSFVAGILIGYTPAGYFLALSRTICFFPFFLLGYYTQDTQVARLRKTAKCIPVAALLLCLLSVIIISRLHLPMPELQCLATAYADIPVNDHVCALIRVWIYAVGTVTTICLIALMPSEPNPFTCLGKHSLPVYVLHVFALRSMNGVIGAIAGLPRIPDPLFCLLAAAIAVLLCALFGNKVVDSAFSRLTETTASLILRKD